MPDFRASERIFQLLTQVAGRAGRRQKRGEVVIQTYSPDHFSLQTAADHDYSRFYEEEIKNRKEFAYPPFSKLIKLIYVHPKKENCIQEIKKTVEAIEKIISKEKSRARFHQAPALIPRLYGKYHWNILLQGKNLELIVTKLLDQSYLSDGHWKIDIDPVFMN